MSIKNSHTLARRLERARRLYELGRYAEALPLLESLVVEEPNYADLWHMLGIAEHHTGHLPRAERALRQALVINPGYTEAVLSLTVLLNDTGRYDEARLLYQTAQKASHNGTGDMEPLAAQKIANMHAQLALAYQTAHKPTLAGDEYKKALELCPMFVDIRLDLANLLFEQGLIDEAIAELKRCVVDKPTFIPAQLRLAGVYVHVHRLGEARAMYEQLLVSNPHLAEAQRGLRLITASSG